MVEKQGHPEHIEYLKRTFTKHNQYQLAAMIGYGKNRWWLSEDPLTIAYHQSECKWLLVTHEQFREAVVKTLGYNLDAYYRRLDDGKARLSQLWKARQTEALASLSEWEEEAEH